MKTKLILSTTTIMIALLIESCKKNTPIAEGSSSQALTPELPQYADNYTASNNDNLAALGRVLFYDKALSLNNSVACASCHQQSKAFCDNLQFSVGLEDLKTSRNSPSIFAKNSRLFWDGRAASISDLVLRPIQNHVEMKFENLKDLETKISKINYYPELFAKAYNNNSAITQSKIKEALSEFLKNFNFSNNKFSRSQRNVEALSATETLGKMVFFGKGRCSGCHHIENSFNIPIDTLTGGGGGAGYGSTDESHNIGLDMVYTDNGIGAISNNSFDYGSFMIPALLNVEFTAPYMHDGRFKTLEEVVEHYNSGIKNHPNLDIRLREIGGDIDHMSEEEIFNKFDTNGNGIIEPLEIESIPPVKLNLSVSEKRALVEFLRTLSDPSIFTEKKFSNPFVMK